MLIPLILGACFAVGHHLFYARLSGSVVSDTNFIDSMGAYLSVQQTNLAIGNVFAFLVKICLNSAIGIAYTQLFWKAIFQKPQTISTVDAMFSSLSNLLALNRGKIWRQNPLLLILALIAWYVSFFKLFKNLVLI